MIELMKIPRKDNFDTFVCLVQQQAAAAAVRSSSRPKQRPAHKMGSGLYFPSSVSGAVLNHLHEHTCLAGSPLLFLNE